MTLPVPKKLADASLDAAIVVYVARHPGAMRADIECSGAVAAILARAETAEKATEWLHERLKYLRGLGVIEQRRWRRGWFVVQREEHAA